MSDDIKTVQITIADRRRRRDYYPSRQHLMVLPLYRLRIESLTNARFRTLRQSTVWTNVIQDALQRSWSLGRYERVHVPDNMRRGYLG